ncbi:hypothetical protein CJ179_48955 [Rhodococcus sp. ACS1]|uniref:hypothetical protein n=1 Tax=Rhodococcus TaxID=1827 RepID=UPI000934C56F|nr:MULTISPECIES: hypothetical protein [Rhodococcus]PBC35192.1 hypothetical protein CJ179_48955 [Rhodococcus sp. ACS1]
MTRRTDTFLGARYRRLAKRGKKLAVDRSILVVAWHLLSDEQATFHDLGSDHYTRHIRPDT